MSVLQPRNMGLLLGHVLIASHSLIMVGNMTVFVASFNNKDELDC